MSVLNSSKLENLCLLDSRRNRDPRVSSVHRAGNPICGHLLGAGQNAHAPTESGRVVHGRTRSSSGAGLPQHS